MNGEEIINSFNKYIKDKGLQGFTILHKQKMPDKTFKAYKEFIYYVWYRYNSKNKALFSVSIKDRCIDEKGEKAIYKRMDEELLSKLFKIVENKEYLNWGDDENGRI